MSSDDIEFSAADLALLAEIAMQQRDALVDQVLARYPCEGRGAEALGVALAILAASSFTSDPEQQHDQAAVVNQVFNRWQHVIAWRVKPL